MTIKFNKNNKGAQNPPAKEKAETTTIEKDMNSHDTVELSKEMTNAIKWVGNQLGTIRPWTGRDNREYATITPKSSAKPPKPYTSVGEVAQAVIDNLKEVGEEAGVAVFASYNLGFKGNKAVGRLISVTEEGKLVVALEIEYAVNSARGGIQTMIPRGDSNDEDNDVEVADSNAGFGKL